MDGCLFLDASLGRDKIHIVEGFRSLEFRSSRFNRLKSVKEKEKKEKKKHENKKKT